MRAFTREELSHYDGRDGRPAYVAYEGKVYDVTDSFLWRDGRHQALHRAGADLTEALRTAPHGPELLARFPVVGVLVEKKEERMRKMTEENLKAAFAGQSQAHMRYLIFAEVAEREGKPNLARLFRAIAYAEQVHATNHYRELGMIRDSPANLDVAIAGETYEVEEMYPAFIAVAELQKEEGAKRAFHFAIEAEKIHAELYKKAKAAAEKGADVAIKTIYICPVCGHTVEGEPPARCPICGAPKEKYKAF